MEHPKFVQLVSLGWSNAASLKGSATTSVALRRDALMALAEDGSVWHWLGREWQYLCDGDKPQTM